jgi:hypothetical protein
VISLNNWDRRIPRIVRTSLLIAGALLVAAGLLLLVVPTFDGPHSRRRANEASAVGKLRTIITLQNQYMAAHAGDGFACELPLLKTAEQRGDAEYDPFRFLITGTQSGYKFSLVNPRCESSKGSLPTHRYPP